MIFLAAPWMATPPGRIQRIVNSVLLSLIIIIIKLRLTTFIKTNDDDSCLFGGELTKRRNVNKPPGLCIAPPSPAHLRVLRGRGEGR